MFLNLARVDAPGLVQAWAIPSHHIVLGPILWEPDVPQPIWWQSWNSERPLIYITVSSTGIDAKCTRPRKIPVTLAVATAERLKLQDMPPNVHMTDYLPGIEICRHASVVLSNGGSATVYQALSHSTPVVGTCSNGDEYLTLKGIDDAGAGLGYNALKIHPVKIRNVISTVIQERRYHTSTAAF